MDSSSALAAVQVASAAAATLALLVLAGRGVINSRVTKRQTTMGGGRDGAAVTPASLPASKPAGLMDKWYAAQPAGEKRYFVQALRVGGRAPSRAELSSALSLVAARHPQLLVLPHPAEDRLYSQITRAECIDEAGTILLPFPLPAAVRCVGETIFDPAAAASAGGSDAAILKLVDDLVNEPVDDDPSLEVFETLDRVAPTWNGVKLQVVVHAESEATAAEAKSFDLVLRMAHTVGDGMSGMLLLRHLLVELGEARVRASAASASVRTTIPLADLTPISCYPSMEDYFDVRPKVRRGLSLLWDGVVTKIRKALGCAPEPWWDGRNEAGEIDASLSASSSNSKRTRCTPIHLSPASLALVASAAKKNGCTVQAALSVAASYATAVSSGRRNLVLHVGTPLSTRGVCAAESAKASSALPATVKALLPPVDGVIGNFLALHMMDVALSTVASAAASAPRFWSLAREYLKSLQTSRPHDLGTMGLIALVDIRAYIRDTHANLQNGRTSSVLVSNVGALDAAPSSSSPSTSLLPPSLLTPLGFELMDSFFAQPVASYVHSVFVVNAVSSARGGLRAIVASPEFLVTDQQAQRFKQAFEAALRNIAEGQDPTCQQVSAEVAQ